MLITIFTLFNSNANATLDCSLCTTDWKYKTFNQDVLNDSNGCQSSLEIRYRSCPTNNMEIQIVNMKIDTTCPGYNLTNYFNNAHKYLLNRVFNLFQISNSPTYINIRIINSKCIKRFGNTIEACDDSCTSVDYAITRGDSSLIGGSTLYTYTITNVVHNNTMGFCTGGSNGCMFTGYLGTPINTFITSYNDLSESSSLCNEICYWKLIGNDNVSATNWLGTKNNAPLVMKTNNIEKMRVTETGKVGIGTTQPFGTLDINCGSWDYNIGKVSFTHSIDNPVSPQIRLYGSLGHYPSNHLEPEYPYVSWYIENNFGTLNFRSGDEHLIGEETPNTRVTILNNGNVGINNTIPTAKLQVTNGAILFDGETGSTPTSGAGTRMMWIPNKAAFRAGILDDIANPLGVEDDDYINDEDVSSNKNEYWDNTNIGLYSIALGRNVKAYGLNDIAIGTFAVANSEKYGTFIDGRVSRNALAIGYSAYAVGNYALSIGNGCVVDGLHSVAIGYKSKASQYNNTSLGIFNNASGSNSSALGHSNIASGIRSSAIGHDNNTSNNDNSSIGNGNFSSGDYSSAIGNKNNASNERSIAIGNYNIALAHQSVSFGILCKSSGLRSVSIGCGYDDTRRLENDIDNSINFGISSTKSTIKIQSNNTGVNDRGNVGIRTDDPRGSLSVNTDNDKGVIIGNSWANDGSSTPGSGSDLVVQRKVGIGTKNPDGALSVIGSNNQVSIWGTDVSFPASDVDLMVQDKVLIGTSSVLNTSTTPEYKLQVAGSVWLSTGSIYNSSDLSLKKDINQFNDGISILKQIQTKKYKYNGKFGFSDKDEHIGIIAQDLQKIMPYAINQDSITQQILVKPSEEIDSVLDYSFHISVIDYNSELDSNRHHKMKDTLIIDKRNQKIIHPAVYRSETSPILTYNTSVLPFLLLNSVKDLDNLRINDSTNAEAKIKGIDKKYDEIINAQTYQKQIDSLGTLVTNQNAQIKDLQEKYESIKKCCESNSIDLYEDVLLEQNNPNPFDQETKISYFIPERLNGPFTMIILDNKNNTIEQYPLVQNVPTTLTISSKNYVTGVYTYSIMDGTRNIIKSKKMMIIK